MALDNRPLLWHVFRMWGKEGGSIAEDIARAAGKGFLAAWATLVVAAVFGGPAAAAATLWAIAPTATVGGTCMIAATAARGEGRQAEEEERQQVRELVSLEKKLPVLESAAQTVEDLVEAQERFADWIEGQRSNSLGRGAEPR
jgi:hypothetical protein